MSEIISLKEAKAHGLKKYFTGICCPRQHFSERYVSSHNCVECCLENGTARCAERRSKNFCSECENPVGFARKITCSPACYLKRNRRYSKQWRSNNRCPSDNRDQRRFRHRLTCAVCKQQFRSCYRSKACSEKCRKKYKAEQHKQWEDRNRRQRRAYANKQYRKHRTERLKAQIEYRKKRDPGKRRATDAVYRKLHRDELNRKYREWRAKNIEACRKKEREWRAKNREKANATSAAYRKRYPERNIERHKRYFIEGPKNPKGEMQWLRKNQAQLRNVKRYLRNPPREQSESSHKET